MTNVNLTLIVSKLLNNSIKRRINLIRKWIQSSYMLCIRNSFQRHKQVQHEEVGKENLFVIMEGSIHHKILV